MNYQESLDWIHSKLKFGIKPGLKRIEWLLEQLSNPQDKIKGVHIVGTNGKGSTVANLQHILTASGYKVGSFTSPYIVDFRERISVDGQMISEEALMNLVQRIYPIVERLSEETGLDPATEFEIITAMMFLYFAEVEPVDIVLVEAGLGGRLDSTNVFQPLVVVCPSIGLDHQNILGNSYVEIAQEKAAVIKDGTPFVFVTERQDVRQVFLEKCQETNSQPYQLYRDFELNGQTYQENGQVQLENVHLGLPGHHQVENAALAIRVSRILQEKGYEKISPETIKQGLAASRWVGRTELMRENLMIDGAHNNESIHALCDLLQQQYADKEVKILFAAIDTKPTEQMIEQLAQVGQVTVTSFDYPNAVVLEQYPPQVEQVEDFCLWLDQSENLAEHQFAVVTGSLYFISQVRAYLTAKK
ncbi:dihydrofolate synthase/folylpolyglutamate synthase [Streptococcus gallinaceus]|uniref:bifunctional folylpolyglutamate synthase/dihydrofolate synthase n=1 Tax=Streptococcus gallinaceus TaxID=165758 RepID=UPI0020A08BB6|nr:folylpolyglutamate synthase/dihydrofolate synthase family protein [Streptococcus gallinaceus]MCP1638707.1 dihydrofolate synthase/folylpolyglutamate synthase [Streptococcus gallinaceus]MCP1769206.1 dihydrofolate synthase/folylpolyglutamate synthase [Streptococcus gallinaceus]